MKRFYLIAPLLFFLLTTHAQKQAADLLLINSKIYTVDSNFSVVSAMAVKDGKILDLGSTAELLKKYTATSTVDGKGKPVFPGFIDAHAHFYRYGLGLGSVNLDGTTSWDQVLNKVKSFAGTHPSGWILGRGWDQNDWKVKEFPTREQLDRLFPERPVALGRVDGHALVVNKKALELSGITAQTRVEGGSIESKNGQPTGVLIDNAMDLVFRQVPPATREEVAQGLLQAQANCFAQGLTTVDDCGLDYPEIQTIDSLQTSGQLRMRVYAMLSDAPANFNFLLRKGKIKTPYLNVRSFKVYADGALGSRGACLLKPYSDKPGWQGFLLSPLSHFDSVAAVIRQGGFQMCTHAIGDSGNRAILEVYTKYLGGTNDLRWRIEHAQVVDPSDFIQFGQSSIIPSVQPTHATSDMYWAKDRLGGRVKSAYAYKTLLNQNGWIPLGTDFPVEDISPFKTFFAAVFREDAKFYPAGGFQMENALTRREALRGMTIWAAKANFEEDEKGSLEKGKLADFVILDTDLMTAPMQNVARASVLSTYSGGLKVYQRK